MSDGLTHGGVRTSVGIDLVRISRIAESLELFGAKFLERVYTEAEVAYAMASPELTAERLAARFAAKEATVKALDFKDTGVGWRDIEVARRPSGACELVLHGAALTVARERGVEDLSVSLSHEGDYATAVVLATCHRQGDKTT
ncbi:MAG TPA: holo-ACP synthase [Polyangia bacterium]|nr:holo-ACP synthase [Polyangia bacterium]